jgi:hypothetical protein
LILVCFSLVVGTVAGLVVVSAGWYEGWFDWWSHGFDGWFDGGLMVDGLMFGRMGLV